jgi:hypothetical protein
MSAPKSLSNELQAIVDNRLDAIDQNLLRAGLPRHQRRSIVEEVENQILEMLMRLEADPWTRQDVLAVLAKLDPPEAYVPEDAPARPAREGVSAAEGVSSAARAGVHASVAAASQMMQTVRTQWKPAWLACFAAALGGFTLLLTMAYLAAIGPSHDSALLGLLLLMLLAGGSTLLGGWSLYHLRQSREQKFALAAALFATLLYPLLILNGVLLVIGAVTYPVSVGLMVLVLFLGINAAVGRLCWRWVKKQPEENREPAAAASSSPLIITG